MHHNTSLALDAFRDNEILKAQQYEAEEVRSQAPRVQGALGTGPRTLEGEQ
jgi:hypothetical protein